jgi:hypothetical protein
MVGDIFKAGFVALGYIYNKIRDIMGGEKNMGF